MKTRKPVMIASILAFVVMSFAISQVANATEDNQERSSKKVAHMSYEQAVQNLSILQAMNEQLEDNFLWRNWPYYTARIEYRSVYIYIQGTYEQWYNFFKNQHLLMKTLK